MIQRVSKILIIADATKQGSILILDSFQIIQKNNPKIKAIFASYLSDLFKKSLGPNTLHHWIKEEEECLERVRSYFARMDIAYAVKVIVVPPWEMIFEEIKDEVPDLMILQGEFFKKWRKNKTSCTLCSDLISQLKCPMLVVNQPEELDEKDFWG
jgi:hypothetical protein